MTKYARSREHDSTGNLNGKKSVVAESAKKVDNALLMHRSIC